MKTIPAELLPAFEACRKIHKKHGKSYYFATRFFPREKRLATFALYAFFRIPDEMVDGQSDKASAQVREELMRWQADWRRVYEGEETTEPILRAAAWVFHAYQIPFEYSESFFAAMIQDTEKASYATYQELEAYMYGSAAVVGLMMTHVIGFQNPQALVYARQLGEAMQLTNFLRDIREDWDERRRVYLPQDELEAFGLSGEVVTSQHPSHAFVEFMRFQIARADGLYTAAEPGIALLSKDGQFAVCAASRLYQGILRKIEEKEYNIFLGRVRTSKWEKFCLAIDAYLSL